jgi:hypothetical protein
LKSPAQRSGTTTIGDHSDRGSRRSRNEEHFGWKGEAFTRRLLNGFLLYS